MPESKGDKDLEKAKARARARRVLWSGTVSFGLISIPVDLLPARRSSTGVSFRMLAPDGTKLRRRYFCPEHDTAIEHDEIVRGYEIEKGAFVVMEDEELEGLAPEASRDIELERFVEGSELSPLWFDSPYVMLPNSDATKPYGLLAEVLEQTGRVGIARFVMRGKMHLVAIRGENGLLRADTLRYANELREADMIDAPAPHEVAEGLVERMTKAIDARAAEDYDLMSLTDERSARIRARAAEKLDTGEDVVETSGDDDSDSDDDDDSVVIDLTDIIAKRLQRPAEG